MNKQGYSSNLFEAYARRITIRDVLLVIGFAVFFKAENYAVNHSVMQVWRVAIGVVSLTALIVYLVSCKITLRWALLEYAIIAYYLLSMVANESDGRVDLGLFYVVWVGGFVTLLEYALSIDHRSAINAFITAGVIMCAIHYYTFLKYRYVPGGMRGDYLAASFDSLEKGTWFFFKHDNGSAFFFFPVMTAMWYRVCKYKSSIKSTIIFTALSLYMYWSQWSVAAMIVFTIATIAFYYVYTMGSSPNIFSWLTYKRALLLGLAICGLSVLIICGSGAIPGWAEMLSKTGSLSARNRIWTRSIDSIKANLLFGTGYELDSTTILKITYNHCHNFILQMLYIGGIFTLLPYIAGLLLTEGKAKDDAEESSANTIISVSIVMLFLLATMDWYLYIPIPMSIFMLGIHQEDETVLDD